MVFSLELQLFNKKRIFFSFLLMHLVMNLTDRPPGINPCSEMASNYFNVSLIVTLAVVGINRSFPCSCHVVSKNQVVYLPASCSLSIHYKQKFNADRYS